MSLKSYLGIDLTRPPYLFYLVIIFAISRFPFIDKGFSSFTSPTDQDVLAVVNSAYLLRYYHVYAVSRFPGSPFYEIFNSLLIGGGWLVTNTATVIISFIAAVLFGKILNLLDIKNKALLLMTFVFIPVIWINSTITMDYMWGLMFLLLAFYLAFVEKYNFSGIAMSFAIATRLTSMVMLAPLLYWMLHKRTDNKRIFTFLGFTILFSIILFSPLFYKYGFGFLSYSPREIPFNEVYNGIITQIFSVPAIIVLFISFIAARDISRDDSTFNLSLLVIFIYSLLFIYHPSKPAYLIPAVPWGLIFLSKSFPRIIVIVLCFLLILNGMVSIEIQNTEEKIKFGYGSVLKNFEERKSSAIQSKEYMDSLSEVLKAG